MAADTTPTPSGQTRADSHHPGSRPFGGPAFWQLPVWLTERKDLRPVDKLLYAVLKGRIEMGPNDHCWPGLRKLARDLGVGRNTAHASVKRLERTGLVRVGKRGRGNCYWVFTPSQVQADCPEGGDGDCPRNGDQSVPDMGTEVKQVTDQGEADEASVLRRLAAAFFKGDVPAARKAARPYLDEYGVAECTTTLSICQCKKTPVGFGYWVGVLERRADQQSPVGDATLAPPAEPEPVKHPEYPQVF